MTAETYETAADSTAPDQREYFAMIPRSIIVGEIGTDPSPVARSMAVHLYNYYDLVFNNRTWPIKGYRETARNLGWDERTVSKYTKALADAGIVRVEQEAKKAARIWVIHNPVRGRTNPDAQVGPAPARHCHQTAPYTGTPILHTVSDEPHGVPLDHFDPSAHDAGGPISPICGSSVGVALATVAGLLDPDEERCGNCGLLLNQPIGRLVDEVELCDGRPF